MTTDRIDPVVHLELRTPNLARACGFYTRLFGWDRARALGAGVPLSPREGPAGWRAIVEAPAGAEVALWQPKP
jgi:predicted enzyme related to lactoylglutathione lyase